MAFVDNSTHSRTILEGIGPVKITLAGTVYTGDPVGYSTGWKAADADNSILAEFVAGQYGISGDVITAYRAAKVGGITTGTAGNTVFLSATAGGYFVTTPATGVTQKVGIELGGGEMWVEPKYVPLFGTFRHVVTAVASNNEEGIAGYMETHLAGTAAGHNYGFGSWINIDDGATIASSRIVVPLEVGVYESAATAISAARIIFGIQAQAILTSAPGSLYFARLNTTQTITAMFAAGNPGSVGYVANTGTSGTKVGYVPLFDIAGGPGLRYIRLYDAGT